MIESPSTSTADELEAIRQLKARYFRLMDTKAWDSWRNVFTDNVVGVFDNAVSTNGADGQPGPTWEGVDELVSSIRAAIEDCTTVHHGYTQEITLTSAATATGIWAMSDVVVFPNAYTLHGAGHYHETYIKSGGVWQIESVHLTRTRMDFVGTRRPVGGPAFVGPRCDNGVMSSAAASLAAEVRPVDRLEVLFEELAELSGQRNAIDSRIVEIVAELDRDELCGMTGARSIPALVAWKTGTSLKNAKTIAAVAHRLDQFPRCAQGMREGRLSLDQVGVIAESAADGSDEHYAQLAAVATVSQLHTAVKLEPRPDPDPNPNHSASLTKTDERAVHHLADPTAPRGRGEVRRRPAIPPRRADRRVETRPRHDGIRRWRSRCRRSRTRWTRSWVWSRPAGTPRPRAARTDSTPPWSCTSTSRSRVAALHLGPLLSDDERAYLTCDATCEVWFQRAGRVIGSGRATRTVNRRLRRALEHRDRCCVVPGCGATRGLHAHHIVALGGRRAAPNCSTSCWSARITTACIIGACITITGPADRLVVTDSEGRRTARGITGPTTHHNPARCGALPRADRRTRRLVVVPTLPTTTTTQRTRALTSSAWQ